MKMPSAKVRRYLYRVALAGVAVLVGYGLLSGEHAALWVALLGPVLGLADMNVTADEDFGDGGGLDGGDA